jgi:hypothetical protein
MLYARYVEDEEDGGHLFFKCKLARQVWQQMLLESQRATMGTLSSSREAMAFLLQQKEEIQTQMVIILWSIWTERNCIREEGRRRSAESLVRSIRIYADEVIRTQVQEKRRKEPNLAAWSRPPADYLKLNCDGSFRSADQSGSWGFIIIRDWEGDVVLTGRGRVNHLLSALHAELVACLQGVQAALNLGSGKLMPWSFSRN